MSPISTNPSRSLEWDFVFKDIPTENSRDLKFPATWINLLQRHGVALAQTLSECPYGVLHIFELVNLVGWLLIRMCPTRLSTRLGIWRSNSDLLLQGVHCFLCHLLANTQCLHSHLLDALKLADTADVGVCILTRPELTRASDLPATFSVHSVTKSASPFCECAKELSPLLLQRCTLHLSMYG